MKRLLILLLFLLAGCSETIVLPVSSELTHEEIVSRIKKLIRRETTLAFPSDIMLISLPEEQISATQTTLSFQNMKVEFSSPLQTTPAYSLTVIEVDTSEKGVVEITINTGHGGVNVEEKVLEILKERANKALETTP